MSTSNNAAAPPGGTFIDNLGDRNFVKVPTHEGPDGTGINTTKFLEAAEGLTTLFDVLGSMAFTPVKNDILGNIRKVRERQLAAPLDSETLQSLVRKEIDAKKHTATEGLLWLTRGLDFTYQSLYDNLHNPENPELAASFRHGYTETLAKVHTMFMKPMFKAAMSAAPYKATFYAKLGDDQELVKRELTQWLDALKKIVDVLNVFLALPENKWK